MLDVFGPGVLRLGVVAAVVNRLHEDAQVALACLAGCVRAARGCFLVDVVQPLAQFVVAQGFGVVLYGQGTSCRS